MKAKDVVFADEVKKISMITTLMGKGGFKFRQRWMKVNKHLTIYYKTGRLIQRLKNV